MDVRRLFAGFLICVPWAGQAEEAASPEVAGVAVAQADALDATPGEAVPVREEIIVIAQPIRDSLEQSIAAQRQATNVVNVVASDTIGRFPDATAAAALSRLPGVAVQRDQGQERYLQLRGAPAQWTAVSFDGINVLGAEDRIFRFDSVPAALIDTVVVNKTLTPDMPAEALAGRVDIQTFSPLEHPGWTLQADGGYGFVDLGDGPQEQYSARLSWANEDFGLMLAGSHIQFEQQADNSEPRWDGDDLLEVRNAKYVIVRETNSASAKADYRLAQGQTLHLTTLYSEFLDHEQRNQYTFNFRDTAVQSGSHGEAEGDFVGVPVVGAFEKGEYKISTASTILGGDHEVAEWLGTWRLAYTETEDDTRLPIVNQSQSEVTNKPSIHYHVGPYGLPVLDLYDTVLAGDGTPERGARRRALRQDAFDGESLLLYALGSESEAWTLKTDWQRQWHWLAPSTFKAGLQYDDRDAEGHPLTPSGLDIRAAAAAAGAPWTPFEFITGDAVDQELDRGYSFNYIDNAGMREQLYGVLDAVAAQPELGITVPGTTPARIYTVSEKIAAGYAMNDWSFGRHQVLAGVRVEHVSIQSRGHLVTASGEAPVSIDHSYTDLFPSVHWNVDLTEDLKLRMAGISGVARPSFDQLSANATISDSSQTINGGNPELDPESAYGADASLEWYFARGALLSVSGFYRDVKDVLYESTTTVGDSRYDAGGISRADYEYTATFNGRSGHLNGVELAYTQPFDFLPERLHGFGFSGSAAFLDGSFKAGDREVAFPGTSERVFNASLYYENHDVSVRVGYQYRSDWLDDVSSDAASDIYWDDTSRVDLSARLLLTPQITLFFDAVNLTDEAGIRYTGDEQHPYEVERFGRRFLWGLRVNFGAS